MFHFIISRRSDRTSGVRAVAVVSGWAHLAAMSRGCDIAGVADVLGTVNLKMSHPLTGSTGRTKSY